MDERRTLQSFSMLLYSPQFFIVYLCECLSMNIWVLKCLRKKTSSDVQKEKGSSSREERTDVLWEDSVFLRDLSPYIILIEQSTKKLEKLKESLLVRATISLSKRSTVDTIPIFGLVLHRSWKIQKNPQSSETLQRLKNSFGSVFGWRKQDN